MRYPWSLNYWKSGEWQVVNERLHDMERDHGHISKRDGGQHRYNPCRRDLFRALSLVPEASVKAVILGQDPYPDARYSTGVAFSIPEDIEAKDFPPTLRTLLQEYSADLDSPIPRHGNLERWCQEGVLLWNVLPSCTQGMSFSHDWDEYSYLTTEILTRLSSTGGIVFCFLGAVARRYVDCVDTTKNVSLVTSHPSPRGSLTSKTPFTGSKIFSTINRHLVDLGQNPIDWELKDAGVSEAAVQGSNLVRGDRCPEENEISSKPVAS